MLSGKVSCGGSAMTVPFAPEVQRLVTAAIVTYALCEFVAVYGLVLFLSQGNTSDFYFFLALSFACFGIHFPKYRPWEVWIAGRGRARRACTPMPPAGGGGAGRPCSGPPARPPRSCSGATPVTDVRRANRNTRHAEHRTVSRHAPQYISRRN